MPKFLPVIPSSSQPIARKQRPHRLQDRVIPRPCVQDGALLDALRELCVQEAAVSGGPQFVIRFSKY